MRSHGNGHHDDEHITPVDPPTLPENVPYIRALAPLIVQLAALNENLALHVHELRVARAPVAESVTVTKLRGAFETLAAIAAAGRKTFAK